jgi:hypothetical protein
VDNEPYLQRSARVSQAAGMVSVQAECSPDYALSLMADRARIEHVSLWALARGVIEHTIRFN